MADTDRSERVESQLDFWRPLSWSSVLFGAVVALAISTMLHILGVGIMASSVDPAEQMGENLVTLGGVSGVWFIISTAVGLFIGGFVAANLSRTFSDERAVVYGLGVWAVSALITIAIATSSLVSTTANVAKAAGNVAQNTLQVVGNAAQGLVTGGAQLAQNVNLPQNVLPDNILRQLEQTLTGGQRGQINPQGAQQILTILQQAIQQGNLTDQQIQRLETAVATTFNITPEEARQRVQALQAQLEQTLAEVRETARQVAEATLTAIATTAYWAFAAILIGALAALIGARYGALDEEDLPRFARLRLTRSMERGT